VCYALPMRTAAIAILALVACSRAEPTRPAAQSYGQVSDGPTVTPATILADVDGYAGKVVRVEGTVAAVCQKRGCWMEIAGAGGASIRIKVKDGEVVFPPSAQGKSVVAEGVVVKIPADPAADTTATCEGGEAHAEHHNCARPPGATARIDAVGATISDS
jgi:hypothetical protein